MKPPRHAAQPPPEPDLSKGYRRTAEYRVRVVFSVDAQEMMAQLMTDLLRRDTVNHFSVDDVRVTLESTGKEPLK